MHTSTEEIEASLAALRSACRLELSCDLISEIRRAVGSRRSEMMEYGIELVAPAVSRLEGVRVFGTSTEVSFVIENLVANAVEAVREVHEGLPARHDHALVDKLLLGHLDDALLNPAQLDLKVGEIRYIVGISNSADESAGFRTNLPCSPPVPRPRSRSPGTTAAKSRRCWRA